MTRSLPLVLLLGAALPSLLLATGEAVTPVEALQDPADSSPAPVVVLGLDGQPDLLHLERQGSLAQFTSIG